MVQILYVLYTLFWVYCFVVFICYCVLNGFQLQGFVYLKYEIVYQPMFKSTRELPAGMYEYGRKGNTSCLPSYIRQVWKTHECLQISQPFQLVSGEWHNLQQDTLNNTIKDDNIMISINEVTSIEFTETKIVHHWFWFLSQPMRKFYRTRKNSVFYFVVVMKDTC